MPYQVGYKPEQLGVLSWPKLGIWDLLQGLDHPLTVLNDQIIT